jgi:hypothetical protein
MFDNGFSKKQMDLIKLIVKNNIDHNVGLVDTWNPPVGGKRKYLGYIGINVDSKKDQADSHTIGGSPSN